MELFVRVKSIGSHQEGVSERTGNPWATDVVVFEDPNGSFSMALKVFGGKDRLDRFHVMVGNVGTLSYTMRAEEYNGRNYTKLEFLGFHAQVQRDSVCENSKRLVSVSKDLYEMMGMKVSDAGKPAGEPAGTVAAGETVAKGAGAQIVAPACKEEEEELPF